jgi:hypothetical protein
MTGIFVLSIQVRADGINTEGISVGTGELNPGFVFDSIKKIHEVSESVLEKGYVIELEEMDAFRLRINGENYYIIFLNLTQERVEMFFPGNRILGFGFEDKIAADINQDGELDIELELKGIKEERAEIFIKEFDIEVPTGEYFELFDVTVKISDKFIYDSKDLSAFIRFENFGEGPSPIEIIYSITNSSGNEVYKGVDFKVVQTEDSVVKDFDFLELPVGRYLLSTDIFYGDNQTAESEDYFEIMSEPILLNLINPMLFIFGVIGLFVITVIGKKVFMRKRKWKRKK